MIRVTNHSPSNKKNQEEETNGNMQEPEDPVHSNVHEYDCEENQETQITVIIETNDSPSDNQKKQKQETNIPR